MGQKVNPHGARVGVIYDWSTRWFAEKKDFADNLVEDFKLREMLKNKYYNTGISKIDITQNAVIFSRKKPQKVILPLPVNVAEMAASVTKAKNNAIIVAPTLNDALLCCCRP